MSAPYLISKYANDSRAIRDVVGTDRECRVGDPIFAMSVGIAAAVVRVNREEKEKGHSTQQILDTLKRRASAAWEQGTGASPAVEKVTK